MGAEVIDLQTERAKRYVKKPVYTDTDLFGNELAEPWCKRGAWDWLFENAAWCSTVRKVGERRIAHERGEICGSYRFFAAKWQWGDNSHGRVQRWFRLLEQRGVITIRKVAGMVMIKLRDYDLEFPAKSTGTTDAVATTQRVTRSVDSERLNARGDQDASQRRKNESRNKDSEVDRERFAPLTDIRAALNFRRNEPKPTATKDGRKEARRQAAFRYINARMAGARAQAATLGMLADDPAVAQEWFDKIDRLIKAEGWVEVEEAA